jgi:hypothetical protein
VLSSSALAFRSDGTSAASLAGFGQPWDHVTKYRGWQTPNLACGGAYGRGRVSCVRCVALPAKSPSSRPGWGHAVRFSTGTLLATACYCESSAFLTGTLDSIGSISRTGQAVDEAKMNYAITFVAGLQPRDQIETTLGVQMAAIHLATMKTAENLGGAKNLQVMDMQERALNRLARTFAAQMEALKRYRSKGEQRVYVERVTVNEGGQAIVGPVAHGGGVRGGDE